MNDEAFEEAMAWTLKTFPQLREVGESAEYLGGFKFSSGSLSYRRMSYDIARFGRQVGVCLLRPKSEALTQVLHPLPPGEHLAISDKWAYKNSKHLPSVAIRETRKHAENFRNFAESQHMEGSRFLFFTLPVSNRRLKTFELVAEIDKSFEIERLFEALLVEGFGEAARVVGLRLELPYRVNTRTFHPHFHGLAVCDDDLSIEDFRASLREFVVSQGLNSCSCDASMVDPDDIGKLASYVFKPCLAAYAMAQATHTEEFQVFVANLKKRVVRTKGPFAEFVRQQREFSRTDQWVDARAAQETETESFDQSGVGPEACEGGSDASLHDSLGPPQNVICGVSKSITLPGGLKGVWSTVKNFSPSAAGMSNRFGKASTLDHVNAAALKCWEDNTGSEYCLKEFLRPFAQEILDLLDEGNVQYCTISCSDGVIKALNQIYEETLMRKNSKVEMQFYLGFWRRIKGTGGRLKSHIRKIVKQIHAWLPS